MSVTFPRGFRAAATTAGLKPSGKPDLALIVCDGADSARSSAACFTQNQVVGAPVVLGRQARARWHSGGAGLRAVLINAGNSNAATGDRGIADARACTAEAARLLGCPAECVVPSSTGIIGRPLAVDKIVAALPPVHASLAAGEAADAAAMTAIMTTDTRPKQARREVLIDGMAVRIGAIAKGAGMIAPRLDSAVGPATPSATMLAFVATDAQIAHADLQRLLGQAAAGSFNRISVDNHASCSDTLICMAGGASGVRIASRSRDEGAFGAALTEVCADLSRQIIADGEGATRVFRVEVRGARTDGEAERIAREVVNSPLVKCAIHGRDPNWGRIVTAAGNAGVVFDPAGASLSIGPVHVYRAGLPLPAALQDPRLAEAMAAAEVECVLTVGAGPGTSWMLGCDLSKEYVAVNADYTT